MPVRRSHERGCAPGVPLAEVGIESVVATDGAGEIPRMDEDVLRCRSAMSLPLAMGLS
jgi:hypothetical protein